jgi:hypothetical protein
MMLRFVLGQEMGGDGNPRYSSPTSVRVKKGLFSSKLFQDNLWCAKSFKTQRFPITITQEPENQQAEPDMDSFKPTS